MLKKPGRPKDQHKEMQLVADLFETTLDNFNTSFETVDVPNFVLGEGLEQAIAHQQAAAAAQREPVKEPQPNEEPVPEDNLAARVEEDPVQVILDGVDATEWLSLIHI